MEQLAKELCESTGEANFSSLAAALSAELDTCSSDAPTLGPVLVRLQRSLFARWDGPALEYHPEGASHVELICTVGGSERRLASWHESFESNGELAVNQNGVFKLDGRSRADALAEASSDYRRFRTLWGDVRLLMRALKTGGPAASPGGAVLPLPPR